MFAKKREKKKTNAGEFEPFGMVYGFGFGFGFAFAFADTENWAKHDLMRNPWPTSFENYLAFLYLSLYLW